MFYCVRLDNLIVSKDDFEELYLEDDVLMSKNLPENYSFKISFPGTVLYKLISIPGTKKNYKLVEKTKYLRASCLNPNKYYCLNSEASSCGFPHDMYKIILTLLCIFILGLILFLCW
ncbi:hypothetical protein EDEG_00067 [Edhazardia aedis USNM 41457]|uniref:Uncharacterized protein n=1 Tax=Edhazardia aedis (strain USNM 41457) TaxID=1003232 RepID=J9DQV3_EDHAE|nr:hypothetical protein EDEG_00067 [Edhazardia aedis USNM 41457]|eukprot:EJW04950.1 hypothetical protein EDEG_00067 [Edhazardia aedis USNM 41457]